MDSLDLIESSSSCYEITIIVDFNINYKKTNNTLDFN